MQKDQIIEELATGRMSRRQFNQKLIALGATMVTLPLGSKIASAASNDHPTVFTWEGWEVPELHQPYITKHGQSPNLDLRLTLRSRARTRFQSGKMQAFFSPWIPAVFRIGPTLSQP